MSSESADLVLVHDAAAELAEAPFWHEERAELLWVNVLQGELWRLHLETGSAKMLGLGQPVGAVGLRRAGGLILAIEKGFALLDVDGDEPGVIARPERKRPNTRMKTGSPTQPGTSGRAQWPTRGPPLRAGCTG